MENQNLIMKTRSISKRKGNILFFVVLFLIFSLIFQPCAFALGRSNAGGGKLASFSVGKWAAGTVIGLASYTIGSYVGNAITPASGFTSTTPLTNWANNYSTMIAVSQSGRAMSMAGQYYGWDPKATLFASSIVSSMVGGGLNPGQFGVSGAFNGIAMGGVYGIMDGAILAGLANDRGQLPPWAGPVAGLASGFGTGLISGGLTNSSNEFSFGNDYNLSNAFGTAMYNTASSVPNTAIGIGLGYATEGQDRQDAYMINQAGSGLYQVGGAIGQGVGNGTVQGLGYNHINVVPNQNDGVKYLNGVPTANTGLSGGYLGTNIIGPINTPIISNFTNNMPGVNTPVKNQ